MISVDQAWNWFLRMSPARGGRVRSRMRGDGVLAETSLPTWTCPVQQGVRDGYSMPRSDVQSRCDSSRPSGRGSAAARNRSGECAKNHDRRNASGRRGVRVHGRAERTAGRRPHSFTGERTRENVVPRGQDVRAGDRLLQKGIASCRRPSPYWPRWVRRPFVAGSRASP